MSNEPKKNNLYNYLLIPVNILKYALYGLKTITLDLFITIYNFLSWNLNKTYTKTKEIVEGDNIYERNTFKKKKKEKTYSYSNRTLAKLEKEKEFLKEDLHTTGATRTEEINAYYFKIREKNGKITTGSMNGRSKLDINAFLVNEGNEVFVIKTSKLINFLYKDTNLMGNPKLNTKDLIFFLTQLSTYLKAGLTLNNSIKILSKQMDKDKVKARAFQAISYELTLGENFSVAMAKQDKMFPPLLINMIKAAEASGTLIETLDEMTSYYTDIHTTKKQMISAITYPSIISVFAIAVVSFILIWVVPQFTVIYAENEAEINALTKAIINISDFLKNNFLYLISIFIVTLLGIFAGYKKIKSFRASMQVLLMKIPVIKDIIIFNELTIFSKTFASLLRNNVFITDSVSILSKITNNEIYKSILYQTINNIIKGEKISEAFEDHWAVPDVAYFMIVTGETTGELGEMMQKVSDYYQEMHKNIVNNLKALIEPMLTAFLAIIVGVIIVAVLIPMYGIYETLG